jgi:hypothetical protein
MSLSRRRRKPLARIAFLIAFAIFCSRTQAQAASSPFSTTITTLIIPQVDYEPAIYYKTGDPYPHLDFAKVDPRRVIQRSRPAVVLQNEFVRITLLPTMGRVYSIVYKPTGHEELWHNDIATALDQGGNPLGFWLWIGGVEHTMPFSEHGSTFALPWTWKLIEDSSDRKTVRMQITEPRTLLEETLDISLYPDNAAYQTTVVIRNPTSSTVDFVHWINPQWTPGGHNELTDHTEFILPTDHITISKEWQQNMRPATQSWPDNRLRFISGWANRGDLNAGALRAGYYSAYSHDEEEGIVRVFDKDKTPGVDVWTYGYHTKDIPMGSGAPNKGYVEMWGGTSKVYGDELTPLAAGATFTWSEWMFPYRQTKGLTFADRDIALNFTVDAQGNFASVGLCPSGLWQGRIELFVASSDSEEESSNNPANRVIKRWSIASSPKLPFYEKISLSKLAPADRRRLQLRIVRTGELSLVVQPGMNPMPPASRR